MIVVKVMHNAHSSVDWPLWFLILKGKSDATNGSAAVGSSLGGTGFIIASGSILLGASAGAHIAIKVIGYPCYVLLNFRS